MADLGLENPALRSELHRAAANGQVGTRLVSETPELRVWHLSLAPGERLASHCHVLDYFWTVLGDGQGRSRFGDGTVREVRYKAGDTSHLTFGSGERMVHDLENTGTEPLLFVTVEFKRSCNAPLPLASEGMT